MKTIDEIVNEAANVADIKNLTFTPVKLTKGDVNFGVVVGNTFTIKQQKYCEQLEKIINKTFGINVTTGIEKALSVVKQASTKLVYLIYKQNNMMVCNADICKPLDGTKLK